jgi:hypothetical protein
MQFQVWDLFWRKQMKILMKVALGSFFVAFTSLRLCNRVIPLASDWDVVADKLSQVGRKNELVSETHMQKREFT